MMLLPSLKRLHNSISSCCWFIFCFFGLRIGFLCFSKVILKVAAQVLSQNAATNQNMHLSRWCTMKSVISSLHRFIFCFPRLCRSIKFFFPGSSFQKPHSPTIVPEFLGKPTQDFVVGFFSLSSCALFPPLFLLFLPWRFLTGMKDRAVGRCGNLSEAVRQVCPQCSLMKY